MVDKKATVIANISLQGMLGYYLYSIAKLGGSILNERVFMCEKDIEFLLRENNVANY